MEIELQPHRAFAIFSLEICVIQATPCNSNNLHRNTHSPIYVLFITSFRDRSCPEKNTCKPLLQNLFN